MSIRRKTGLVVLVVLAFYIVARAQDNINTRFMLAKSMEQGGDLPRAQAMYEELLRLQPSNYAILESLNSNYLSQKKTDLSLALLLPRVKANPADMNLVLLLGKTYFLKGEEKAGFQLWDEFLEKNGNKGQMYRAFASAASELRVFEKAIEYLQKGKSASGDQASLSYEIANLYCLTMNYRAAAAEYVRVLEIDPAQAMMVEGRMMSYYGKPEALDGFIREFSEAAKSSEPSSRILGRLYLEAKRFEDAFRVVQQIDSRGTRQGEELLALGQQLQAAGAYGTARKAFEYILTQYPRSQTAKLAKLNIGKAREAEIDQTLHAVAPLWKPKILEVPKNVQPYLPVLSAYDEIVRLYPHSEPALEARFRTGIIYFACGRDDSAKQVFRQLLKDYSLSSYFQPSCEYLASIYLRGSRADSSAMYLTKILENPYSSPAQANSARFRLATLHFYKDEFEPARVILRELLRESRDDNSNDALELSMLLNTAVNDSQLVSQYARVLMSIETGQFRGHEDALLRIAGAKNQFFLKSLSEVLRVELAIGLDEYGLAVALINTAISEKSNIFEDKLFYYLARVYQFGLNDLAHAAQTYETFLAQYPASLYTEKVRTALNNIKSTM